MKKTLLLISAFLLLGAACSKQTAPQTQTPTGKKNAIVFENNAFTPAEITVKKGDAVSFLNKTEQNLWPASGVHPTHALYPTTGGCLGSTFDACRALKTGEEFTFTFDIVGTWPFHDHLHPDKRGKVIVTE
ncbi:MAG: cupredoxin domain-containing protein [Parcubacteria group bacterium]|nr:cupredoxin domain-containing protein [Parcubacteria group bacterium]